MSVSRQFGTLKAGGPGEGFGRPMPDLIASVARGVSPFPWRVSRSDSCCRLAPDVMKRLCGPLLEPVDRPHLKCVARWGVRVRVPQGPPVAITSVKLFHGVARSRHDRRRLPDGDAAIGSRGRQGSPWFFQLRLACRAGTQHPRPSPPASCYLPRSPPARPRYRRTASATHGQPAAAAGCLTASLRISSTSPAVTSPSPLRPAAMKSKAPAGLQDGVARAAIRIASRAELAGMAGSRASCPRSACSCPALPNGRSRAKCPGIFRQS